MSVAVGAGKLKLGRRRAAAKRSRPPAGSAGGRVGRRLLARCKRRGGR